MPQAPRLAELVGSLSLATDLAAGFGLETALRTCLLAVKLGQAQGLSGEPLREVYFTGLLRFIGCTAFSHEQAYYGAGDDQAFSRVLAPVDGAAPSDVLRTVVGQLGRGAGPLARTRAVVRTLADPQGPRKFASAHCDLALRLAPRLGMSAAVTHALSQIYERWDGKGQPAQCAGDAIALPARLMHVAFRAEITRALSGPAAALEAVRARAGNELDPQLSACFAQHAPELLTMVGAASVWDAFLDAEPLPCARLNAERVSEVAEAFAHFVDIKSPFTLGHSVSVASLAEQTARELGLDPAPLRLAGFLHDLGRVSVPNGIWDKPARLNPAEWERVRMHAYHGERILAQSSVFAELASIVGQHHERLDASGYHRGIHSCTRAASALAAADVYQALCEARAHRPAHAPANATDLLAREAKEGRLARDCVEAVLAAAGQRARRVRGAWPADLSDREVEVLTLLARGLSNKQIATQLFISPKTVQHHVAHIYEKTGVKTRASAALFAVENELLRK